MPADGKAQVAAQVRRSPVQQHAALMNDHDAIHKRFHIPDLVCRDHDGLLFVDRFGHKAPEDPLRRDVEAVGRLVQKHERGVARQTECQQELLLLAVRELCQSPVFGDLELLELPLHSGLIEIRIERERTAT